MLMSPEIGPRSRRTRECTVNLLGHSVLNDYCLGPGPEDFSTGIQDGRNETPERPRGTPSAEMPTASRSPLITDRTQTANVRFWLFMPVLDALCSTNPQTRGLLVPNTLPMERPPLPRAILTAEALDDRLATWMLADISSAVEDRIVDHDPQLCACLSVLLPYTFRGNER